MRDHSIPFGPFRIHPTQGLFKHGREIRIRPKTLSVLIALARHKGSIVTKQELFSTVWANRVVTDSALSSCIREVRIALGDNARDPRYIQTVHGRGFRLLADRGDCEEALVSGSVPAQPWVNDQAIPGRDRALEVMSELAESVCDGPPVMAFVSGPAGIGKGALTERFLADLPEQPAWLSGRVDCTDPSAAGNAYGPLINLIGQLSRGPTAATVTSMLAQLAPTWWAELPAAREASGSDLLRLRVSGATTTRRHRELRQFLEALTESSPLAIGIGHIDRCDVETLNWLDSFLRDPGDASVFVVATCQDATANGAESSECLASLRDTGACVPIELDSGTGDDVTRRIRRFVEQSLHRLTEADCTALEAASVAGVRFSAEEVAAATGVTPSDVASSLDHVLEKTGLVSGQGRETWPDGTKARQYAFGHELVRTAILDRVPMPQRALIHRRIGRRLAEAWSGNLRPVAARVAAHFEEAGATDRAVACWYEAGTQARHRGSHPVAIRNFRRAQTLLDGLTVTAERKLQAAKLYTAIGRELAFCHGLDAQAVIDCFRRGDELKRHLPESRELARVLWALWVFHLSRGPLPRARALAEELLELGLQLDDPALQLQGHHACWATALALGEVAAVHDHTRRGMAVCGSGANGSLPMTSGCTLHDAHLSDHHGAVCAGFANGWADVLRDSKTTAVMSMDAAISHARDIGHVYTMAVTLTMSAGALAAAGDAGLTRLRAAEGRSIAEQHGFDGVRAWAAVYEGWARVELGDASDGLKLLNAGLDTSAAMGLWLFRPFQLALAAAAKLTCGLADDAGAYLREALAVAARTGDRLALAEIHRLRAELHLKQDDTESRQRATAELESVIDIAHAQGALLWETRALERLGELTGSASAAPRSSPRRPFRLVE